MRGLERNGNLVGRNRRHTILLDAMTVATTPVNELWRFGWQKTFALCRGLLFPQGCTNQGAERVGGNLTTRPGHNRRPPSNQGPA
jgi:hypothetical protein